MRPVASDLDPVSAYVYGPTRILVHGVESGQDDDNPTLIVGPTRIVPPRAMYATERENQGHPNSTSDMIIEVRNEGGGDQLTGDMWIVHRNRRYDIKGRYPIRDWARGTTPYQVTYVGDYIQN